MTTGSGPDVRRGLLLLLERGALPRARTGAGRGVETTIVELVEELDERGREAEAKGEPFAEAAWTLLEREGLLTTPLAVADPDPGRVREVGALLAAVSYAYPSMGLALHMQWVRLDSLRRTGGGEGGRSAAARLLVEAARAGQFVGAGAVTELGRGYNTPSVRARPGPDGGWVVDGSKDMVTLASIATDLFVRCRVDTERGPACAMVVVSAAEPGVVVGDPYRGGLRGAGTCRVDLDGAPVRDGWSPEDDLQPYGDAVADSLWFRMLSSCGLLAVALGVAARALTTRHIRSDRTTSDTELGRDWSLLAAASASALATWEAAGAPRPEAGGDTAAVLGWQAAKRFVNQVADASTAALADASPASSTLRPGGLVRMLRDDVASLKHLQPFSHHLIDRYLAAAVSGRPLDIDA